MPSTPRDRKMAAFRMKEVLPPRALEEMGVMVVVDVGAMSLGGADDVHTNMLQQGLCEVVGFEGNEEECKEANEKALKAAGGCDKVSKVTFFPYVVGNGEEVEFKVGAWSATSSIYEPNMQLVTQFQTLASVMHTVKRAKVQSRRLDDIWESEVKKPALDFIKLDIQGAELQVLQGATSILKTTLVVEVEVEFVQLYQSQPLFADVDTFLRGQGFTFHRFTSIQGRAVKPLSIPSNPHVGTQHLWGDAVYVRDPFSPTSSLTPSQLLRTATILHECYQSYDIAHHYLTKYDAKSDAGPPAVAPVYLEALTQRGITEVRY